MSQAAGGATRRVAAPLPAFGALPPAAPGLRAVIVVPARDEEAHLGRALAALMAQHDGAGRPLDPHAFELLVFANNCGDGTAAVARAFADAAPGRPLVHVVEAEVAAPDAHIGYVRRQLMDAACARLESIGATDALVASTDADSVVAGDWLQRTLDEAARGADAVGGRIVNDASTVPDRAALRLQRLDLAHSLLRSRLEDLIDPDPADPWPRHHQHFGASLAVRAHSYRACGGVPDVEFLEDEALVAALRRSGARVRHSPRVRVTTSSRLDGRAAVGLAWRLRQWADEGSPWRDPLVESAPRCIARLEARAALRRSHRDDDAAALGRALERFDADARRELDDPVRRDALAAAGGLVPQAQACAGLRLALRRRLSRRGAVAAALPA